MFQQDSDDMFEDDSGSDTINSSDDERDVMLHDTSEQERKLHHLTPTLHQEQTQSERREDDFEREMNAELNNALRSVEQRRWTTNDQQKAESAALEDGKKSVKSVQFYDEVYFDSDDDDEKDPKQPQEQTNDSKAKSDRRRLTDDELLYDPNMDDDDQSWVNAQRQRYQPQHHTNQQNQRPGGQKRQTADRRGVQPLPNSDAVLDCPACMTTLCTDCQQHSLYKNQYRAMFVTNCIVDNTEKVSYPKNMGKKNKKRKHLSKTSGTSDMSMNEQYQHMKSQVTTSMTSQMNTSMTSQMNTSVTSQMNTSLTSQMNTAKHAENEPAKNDVTNSVIENCVKSDCHAGGVSIKDDDIGSVVSIADSSVQTNLSSVNMSGTVVSPEECTTVNPALEDNTEVQVVSTRLEVPGLDEDCYHPVKCSECNTVVAVFDSDEVYHFFNVLTSYG